MLVLARYEDTEIVLRWTDSGSGDVAEAVIRVVEIDPGRRGEKPKVRYGISAPSWVEIDRREIRDAKDGK